MIIEYKINTASEFLLIDHLTRCNDQFIPPLNTKVSIEAYGKKISENAVVFEAWDGNVLIGMVAMYVKENTEGYITNVSVYSDYRRKGIAKQIFNNLLTYSEENNIPNIRLQVNVSNAYAISLYKKFGFKSIDKKNNQIIMLKKTE